jgi:hypothetical protein
MKRRAHFHGFSCHPDEDQARITAVWQTDYKIADAQTIANAVIRHGNDDNIYKHFEDAAVDLVSTSIIHLGYVFWNLDSPRKPTLPNVLAHYSQPGMDFTDVLV